MPGQPTFGGFRVSESLPETLLVGPGLRSQSAHCWVLSGLCCLPGRAVCGGPSCSAVSGPCFAQEIPGHLRLAGGTRPRVGLWKSPVQGTQFAAREHFGCSFASDHLSSTHMTLTPGQSLSLSEHCHGVSDAVLKGRKKAHIVCWCCGPFLTFSQQTSRVTGLFAVASGRPGAVPALSKQPLSCLASVHVFSLCG